MILIWSRWGIVVFALALAGLGIGAGVEALLQSSGVVPEGDQDTAFFLGLGLAFSGLLVWVFERYVLTPHLDKPRLYTRQLQLDQPQTLEDGTVQTHVLSTVQVRPRSTLFFVPFKYWWIILVALGGLTAIIGIFELIT